MLGLLHDPLLKYFGRIVRLYLNCLLEDYRPAVGDGVDKVHGGSRHLDPPCQCGLVDMEPIHASTAEGGDERRMDVYYPAAVFLAELGAEYLEIPGKDDEIGSNLGFQQLVYPAAVFLGRKAASRDVISLDPGLFSPDEGVGVLSRGDDGGYLAAKLSPVTAVYKRLEVGP